MKTREQSRGAAGEADVSSIVESKLAGITRGILLLATVVAVLVLAVNVGEEGRLSPAMWVTASTIPLLGALLRVAARGHTQAAARALVVLIYLVIVGVVIARGTIRVPAPSLIILGAAVSGLVLGRRSMIVALAGGTLVVGGLALSEAWGLLQTPTVGSLLSYWLSISVFAIVTGVVLSYGRSMAEDALLLASSEIAERRETEHSLRVSEERLRVVVDTALDAVITIDTAGCIAFWNAQAETVFGWSRHEAMGQTLAQLIVPLQHREAHAHGLAHYMADGVGPVLNTRIEITALRKNGEEFPVELAITPARVGNTVFFSAFLRDITRRKQAESALHSSLRDKEALLKEVHHRVKNNLQVITSLLRLESGRSAQPDTKSVLIDMQSRIRSMALLHESLYRSGTFAAVDLGAYLKQIATESFRTLIASPGSIQLRLDLASVPVGLDQALPCGLLVNELISNCLKHGFPDGRTGDVLVELHALDGGSELRLRVSDTGVGLPADFEAKREQSLGLQLVSDLTMQLRATLDIGPWPAAVFAVTFTIDELRLSSTAGGT